MRICVELDMFDLCMKCRNEDEMQFAARQTLRSAGIPVGKWGSSAPKYGTLCWRDDDLRGVRIVEWAGPEEPK
jgi:hypothetical protein